MAKRLRLTPIKTPLCPDSLKMARAIQWEISAARADVDKTRASTVRESPHITRLIGTIPFINAQLADGTPVALKFVAGRNHADTGLPHYIALDREEAQLFVKSGYADYQLRLDPDGNGSFHVYVVRPAHRTTLAGVLFALANPGVRFKKVLLRDRSSLNFRRSNLEAELPDERRSFKSTVPDLGPYAERISLILGVQEGNDAS